MKSLLVTAILSLGVAHSGAFLEVWDVPYVQDHFTLRDLTRKLDRTFKVKETTETLRNARNEAAEENYSLITPQEGPKPAPAGSGYHLSGQKIKNAPSSTKK